MPGALFDTNIWLAVVFATHPGHAVARQALQTSTAVDPAVFCRATEQSFLRLLTTPALLRTYGAEGLSNRDALTTLHALQGLQHVRYTDEPPGTAVRWHALAARDTASPKLWMDAYLAAFAIAGGLKLLTLDADFRQFIPQGLQATVLGAA
jgi:uncharacterized protein